METIFKVDISSIKDLPGQTMEINEKIDFPDINVVGNKLLKFLNPWQIILGVINVDQGFQVDGKIKGSCKLTCDRCLKEVQSYLEIEVTDNFLPVGFNGEIEEDDKIFSGDVIDLTITLIEAINLKLPMKNLCSPDCQGLCPVCGLDLNTQTCECQQDDFDPRLASLLKWKEQQGGGSDGQS